MIITSRFEALPNEPRIFALGNFDGVHLGHQALLKQAISRARQIGGVAVAFALSPHPLQVLGYPIETIVTSAGKARLLAELGLDAFFLFPFTKQVAQMAPTDFVESILLKQARAQGLVVGFNYSFGRKAAGTPEFLREYLRNHKVSVDIVPPVLYAGEPISSTRIRHHLRQGDLAMVETLLGRSYSITGLVQPGEQRGRNIGFPTANIDLAGLALPPFGVYAAEVVGIGYGMANLGVRPSFPQSAPTLEVHIFDFADDLYGQEIEVRLLTFIRSETRFANLSELKQQLALDKETILNRLSV